MAKIVSFEYRCFFLFDGFSFERGMKPPKLHDSLNFHHRRNSLGVQRKIVEIGGNFSRYWTQLNQTLKCTFGIDFLTNFTIPKFSSKFKLLQSGHKAISIIFVHLPVRAEECADLWHAGRNASGRPATPWPRQLFRREWTSKLNWWCHMVDPVPASWCSVVMTYAGKPGRDWPQGGCGVEKLLCALFKCCWGKVKLLEGRN